MTIADAGSTVEILAAFSYGCEDIIPGDVLRGVPYVRPRAHVVRIFPNGQSCLRLVWALAVETHENWLEQHRYLNMDDLREHKKEALRRAA